MVSALDLQSMPSLIKAEEYYARPQFMAIKAKF